MKRAIWSFRKRQRKLSSPVSKTDGLLPHERPRQKKNWKKKKYKKKFSENPGEKKTNKKKFVYSVVAAQTSLMLQLVAGARIWHVTTVIRKLEIGNSQRRCLRQVFFFFFLGSYILFLPAICHTRRNRQRHFFSGQSFKQNIITVTESSPFSTR